MMLMDVVEKYKQETEAAKRNHPNDINICNIEGQVNGVIKEMI